MRAKINKLPTKYTNAWNEKAFAQNEIELRIDVHGEHRGKISAMKRKRTHNPKLTHTPKPKMMSNKICLPVQKCDSGREEARVVQKVACFNEL